MQNMQTLVSGSTTFGQLYALLNNNMTTLASQFSGSTFPANPTTGQPCYRTDKNPPVWYIFNGTTWEDGAMASAVVTALLAETQKARGTAATLDARLDVALNADGTLKATTPAGGWWTQETGTIARVSASSFSVAGDRRQIYTALRAVRLAQNTDADSHVVTCSYAAESDLTIVTIDDSVVDVGITTVFYGIDVASTPDFSSNADLAALEIKVSSAFLAGGIVMFSGTFGGTDGKRPIPVGATDADEGWALCDGSNGTPDLRGRFIIGAGGSYVQGATGGAASASVSGATGETTLTIGTSPSHAHDLRAGTGGDADCWGLLIDGQTTSMTIGGPSSLNSYRFSQYNAAGDRTIQLTGGSQSHNHNLSATVSTLPPYYALAYIMKLPTA